MSDLPPGFVLDQPTTAAPPQASGLPAGFVLDNPSMSGIAEDMAKTVVPAVGRMAAGLAGLPADLAHLYAPNQNDPNPLGSSGLGKDIEPYTGSYQPQTEPGKVLDKAIQFAPAVIGGPETLAAKLATRVVAPAVASEAAGKLTEGTAAQPYAELAGALAGGAGASMAANKLSALSAARGAAEIPTVDEIKAAARAQYQHPDVQAVQIKPDVVSNLADTISSDLQHGQNSGFRPANEPKVFSAVDELKNAAAEGRPATVADLDSVRQVLGNAAKETDVTGSLTRQAVAANRAIDHIDNFLPSLQQPDLIAGDAAKANGILDTARQNWGAAKRAERVQTLAANAEINAASANSGGNLQNATKQAFKPLLKNDFAKASGYTDIEKQALNKIVRGTWTGTAARAAGNLLGGGGGLGMLAGGAAGYEEGGIPGAIGVGLAGRALKKIGTNSTLGAVRHLDGLLRSRAPEALKVAAQNPKIVQLLPSDSVKALRALIYATPELSEQQKHSVNQARHTVSQNRS